MHDRDDHKARSQGDRLLGEVVELARRGALQDAHARFAAARAKLGDQPRVHGVRGLLHLAEGQTHEAIAAFKQAVAGDPRYVVAHRYLAELLEGQGQLAEALATLERIVALDPTLADVQARRVLLTAELGRPDEALSLADAAIPLVADATLVRVARGLALRHTGRLEEALALQESILAAKPELAVAWGEKAAVLHALGQHQAALDAYDQALELDENNIFCLNGIGLVEYELGMHEAALAAFNQALTLSPENMNALFYRALVHEAKKRYTAALADYGTILARQPDSPLALSNIAKIQRDRGSGSEAEAAFKQALERAPDSPVLFSNYICAMLYNPAHDPDTLARAHRAYGERFGQPPGRYTHWPNDRDPARPLKVGIVSAELRRHPVSSWLLPSLERLSPEHLPLTCYATQVLEDDVTQSFKDLAERWRPVAGLDATRLAKQIREDEIDILIDTTGHTGNNRLPCFGLKPAPVQASWLGYPFTTGLTAIDYTIMDRIAVPPGEEGLFTETVVRLPGGRFCYAPFEATPPIVAPPVMRNGWITFGSFNNITKLTPDVLDLYCRILRGLPTARLILKTQAFADAEAVNRIREQISGRGITPGRLELRGPSSYTNLLGEYGDIDVALDPFPFGGGATTCDALWMGVPVVTLRGRQPASRQTEECLTAIGRTEWVADDLPAYERIARTLASDPLHLADCRHAQRHLIEESPLCDKARLGDELGEALRAMWRSFATSRSTP